MTHLVADTTRRRTSSRCTSSRCTSRRLMMRCSWQTTWSLAGGGDAGSRRWSAPDGRRLTLSMFERDKASWCAAVETGAAAVAVVSK